MATGNVEFNSDYVNGDTAITDFDGEKYFLCITGDKMHCSCGRELVKKDDGTFQCKGGYPTYRPDQGEVMKGKDGEYWLKVLPHTSENN